MKNYNRFVAAPIVLGVLALPAFVIATGCGGTDTLCCSEFKVGADLGNVDFGVDASAKGTMTAFAQASADLAATAQGMVDDVTVACRNIANDLGSPDDQAQRDAASKLGGRDAMKAWCDLAIADIGKIKAQASITATVTGGRCDIDVSVKAKCQAQCDVKGQCDIKATPPTCKGGQLVVDCKGGCDITADAPKISCEGSCAGTCEGSCSATAMAPSVQCDGKCSGTCSASGGAGNTGAQADGTCKGSCSGTCTARPGSVAASCTGSCHGSCNAKCTASPGSVSAKCSGHCDIDAQPIRCEGGTLEGGCKVEANCDANCSGSASAKASCTPPEVKINISAGSNAQQIAATLEANIPLLVGVLKRGVTLKAAVEGVAGSGSASVSAVVSSPSVKGAACIGAITSAVTEAVQNVQGSLTISASVTTNVGAGGA